MNKIQDRKDKKRYNISVNNEQLLSIEIRRTRKIKMREYKKLKNHRLLNKFLIEYLLNAITGILFI